MNETPKNEMQQKSFLISDGGITRPTLTGGTINCSGKFHNIKLTMREYVLNSPMLSIPMGGADVVLGVQWLQSLGTVAFNFQELFLKFF